MGQFGGHIAVNHHTRADIEEGIALLLLTQESGDCRGFADAGIPLQGDHVQPAGLGRLKPRHHRRPMGIPQGYLPCGREPLLQFSGQGRLGRTAKKVL